MVRASTLLVLVLVSLQQEVQDVSGLRLQTSSSSASTDRGSQPLLKNGRAGAPSSSPSDIPPIAEAVAISEGRASHSDKCKPCITTKDHLVRRRPAVRQCVRFDEDPHQVVEFDVNEPDADDNQVSLSGSDNSGDVAVDSCSPELDEHELDELDKRMKKAVRNGKTQVDGQESSLSDAFRTQAHLARLARRKISMRQRCCECLRSTDLPAFAAVCGGGGVGVAAMRGALACLGPYQPAAFVAGMGCSAIGSTRLPCCRRRRRRADEE